MELNKHAFPLLDKDGNERTNAQGGKLLAMGLEVKAEPQGENTLLMVASTEEEDRAGDIIRAAGWDFKAFEKNPVILWGHDHSIPAVMSAPKTWVEGSLLKQVWYSDPAYRKTHQLANIVWHGHQPGGPLNASSVGFMPKVMRPIENEDGGTSPIFIAGLSPTEYVEQELYETSSVNVPANREALQVLRSKGLDTRPLEEHWQHMEKFFIDVSGNDIEQTKIDDDAPIIIPSVWSDPDTTLNNTITTWCGDEENGITIRASSDEKLEDMLIEELESRGYEVKATEDTDDTDVVFELEPEPELEVEIEHEPEPSVEIDAEELKDSVREYVNEKIDQKIQRALKREFNKRYGILED